jgi:putative glutamine amidotransferase
MPKKSSHSNPKPRSRKLRPAKKPASASARSDGPVIGVPWRTLRQETRRDLRLNRDYLEAVRAAGGNPVQISLQMPPGELARLAHTLDAIVLPGSPADVSPKYFRATPHPRAAKPDIKRENTDFALLRHALPAGKPVLAICYGTQLLNVHLGGSLFQDIPSELRRPLVHSSKDHSDAMHAVRITGGYLAELAGLGKFTVNSLHHQSVQRLGRGLRATARAADGVIEAVEWTRGPGWVVGVQWHPERMPRDPLAKKLFKRLVSEAARAAASRRPPRATRTSSKRLHRRRNKGARG